MISKTELDYAEKLIAAISSLNIQEIPFGERRFQEGMDKLADYFNNNSYRFKNASKISLLFIRKPITGSYDRMLEALQYLNGSYISFAVRNPRYENTQISVTPKRAESILSKSDEDFPKELMLKSAEYFCKAAGIMH